ncbi:hypothetical protein E2C01_045667 [Portunus trituberculatus]|uniref:Uncharacterized protein n=1 Tax=Portunus trituberculatus TaxID=210409 RepID=A0A5B7G3L3_PORTR|nr:hypothetical protein [Portunus trituberculatus]
MWEALLNFHPLVVQAILFIVVPILGPISPPKRIFGVTTENLGILNQLTRCDTQVCYTPGHRGMQLGGKRDNIKTTNLQRKQNADSFKTGPTLPG